VDLRVAAEEPLILVLGFALPRLAADFLVALRPVAAADPLPPAERFALPRLVVVPPLLAAAFFVVKRFLRLRGFLGLPVRASTILVAALDTASIAASTLVLAALAIASCAVSISPSFSFPLLPPIVTSTAGSVRAAGA
jgi:hypothetical protein